MREELWWSSDAQWVKPPEYGTWNILRTITRVQSFCLSSEKSCKIVQGRYPRLLQNLSAIVCVLYMCL